MMIWLHTIIFVLPIFRPFKANSTVIESSNSNRILYQSYVNSTKSLKHEHISPAPQNHSLFGALQDKKLDVLPHHSFVTLSYSALFTITYMTPSIKALYSIHTAVERARAQTVHQTELNYLSVNHQRIATTYRLIYVTIITTSVKM